MNVEQKLNRADLHVHTTASDGMTTPGDCLELARSAKLNVIALTDHDETEGAIEASRKAKEKGLPITVVIGSEITTVQGHLVTLFIKEKIPMFLSLFESVKRIHEQNGLAIAPHLGWSIPIASISPETIVDLYKKGQWLDGIEVFHPLYSPRHQVQAETISRDYKIAPLGVSDDHLGNMGRFALTYFSGDLREALRNRQTRAVMSELLTKHVDSQTRIKQHVKALSGNLPEKMSQVPVLISTLISLQRQYLKE